MNNQYKVAGNTSPDDEFISSAWLDVKLCTVRALEHSKELFTEVKGDSIIIKTTSDFNYSELHYGNYE